MIFKRAAIAELTNTAGAVFTVLFSIAFSVVLVRILGEAAGGNIDSQAVFSLVALTALTHLPTILTLTVFIAVLMTITRSFRDHEMVVWLTTGQSLLTWIGPVLRFAGPVIVVNAVLALVVSPWANEQITASKKRFESRDDVSKIAPGRFAESASAGRVFFVESVDLDGARVHNVFVSQTRPDRENIIVAAQGVVQAQDDGQRYLVLEQGRRYEGLPGQAQYRLMDFERYAIRLDAKPHEPLAQTRTRDHPTAQLWQERSTWSMAELLWRLGLPAVTLTLALLAIPLGYINPRVGRSSNLIIAILVFMTYNSTQSVVQTKVQQGTLSFGVGLWLVHAAVLLIAAVLFVRRVYMQRWFPAWLSWHYWLGRDKRPSA
ncbi:MAG TPA: LPS export ABC transporter permease LptF [Burkholderiaceae bacterium]|nr:LPS export ABC transporter permease LptF [Burkholderiaceae bacterium]